MNSFQYNNTNPLPTKPQINPASTQHQKSNSQALWNGIIPTPTPWIAAGDALGRKQKSFQRAVFAKSGNTVLTASRHKPTTTGQQWRQHILIHTNQSNKQGRQTPLLRKAARSIIPVFAIPTHRKFSFAKFERISPVACNPAIHCPYT